MAKAILIGSTKQLDKRHLIKVTTTSFNPASNDIVPMLEGDDRCHGSELIKVWWPSIEEEERGQFPT